MRRRIADAGTVRLMIGPDRLRLRVRDIEPLSPSLKRFRLAAVDGGALPIAPPGSHLLLTLVGPQRRWLNAYSLTGPTDRAAPYEIIVRRVERSRGGSGFLHGEIGLDAVIEAGMPANLFPIVATARKHLLIGGGVGITPFLSYLPALGAAGQAVEMHHFCRADEATLYERLLAVAGASSVYLHVSPTARTIDIAAILRRQPLGTHLYLCGPDGLMDAVRAEADALGWPGTKLHLESFGAGGVGRPFRVILQRSGVEIEVAGDQSVLDAVEAMGFAPPCLCRGGACGECLTRVVAGIPEHRDSFLSAAERESNEAMMICVSRAEGTRLVLDL
jgi:ferredoxin-NADP reductase